MLWVDALCIDQRNIEERNLQVLRMGEIYQNAKSVQVWLGPDADDSDLAIALVKDMQDLSWQDECLKDLGKYGGLVADHARKWRAIAIFMERPWFCRVSPPLLGLFPPSYDSVLRVITPRTNLRVNRLRDITSTPNFSMLGNTDSELLQSRNRFRRRGVRTVWNEIVDLD
jgi:hypothetical protein